MVAIIADNASTIFGGEAIIPYHYFRLLTEKQIETWLVVHSRCRKELQTHFPAFQERIIFLDDTPLESFLFTLESFPLTRFLNQPLALFRQMLFQYRQSKQVKQLVREKGISLLHQPIPVSPKQPSFLYQMGAPVIVGPMNGGMEMPRGMRDFQGPLSRLAIHAGRSIAEFLNQLFPGKKEAALLLVANERSLKALPEHCGTVKKLVENGVDLSLIDGVQQKSSDSVTFIFVGRLIELKGVDYLIQAFQKIDQFPCELRIIGDGPDRKRLEKIAGGDARIHFLGFIPWKKCFEHIQASDVLLLPSMMDCGGAAVLEGMACGLPVIATDWGGPKDYIDPSCGILVPPENDQQFVEDLARAMVRLGENKTLREEMGRAGLQKVLREFTWEAKIDKIIDMYKDVVRE